mgnify:CR=1 FL=1
MKQEKAVHPLETVRQQANKRKKQSHDRKKLCDGAVFLANQQSCFILDFSLRSMYNDNRPINRTEKHLFSASDPRNPEGQRERKRKERWQFSMYTGRTIHGGTDTKEKKGKNVFWRWSSFCLYWSFFGF